MVPEVSKVAKRGPKPTPTAELRLRGSWRADIKGDDIIVESGRPVMPDWLGEAEREVYADLLPLVERIPNLLTPMDGEALGVLAAAMVEFRRLSLMIRVEGEIIEDAKGEIRENPALKARDRAWLRLKHGWACFGLTPADRAGLKIQAPPNGGKAIAIGGL